MSDAATRNAGEVQADELESFAESVERKTWVNTSIEAAAIARLRRVRRELHEKLTRRVAPRA